MSNKTFPALFVIFLSLSSLSYGSDPRENEESLGSSKSSSSLSIWEKFFGESTQSLALKRNVELATEVDLLRTQLDTAAKYARDSIEDAKRDAKEAIEEAKLEAESARTISLRKAQELGSRDEELLRSQALLARIMGADPSERAEVISAVKIVSLQADESQLKQLVVSLEGELDEARQKHKRLESLMGADDAPENLQQLIINAGEEIVRLEKEVTRKSTQLTKIRAELEAAQAEAVALKKQVEEARFWTYAKKKLEGEKESPKARYKHLLWLAHNWSCESHRDKECSELTFLPMMAFVYGGFSPWKAFLADQGYEDILSLLYINFEAESAAPVVNPTFLEDRLAYSADINGAGDKLFNDEIWPARSKT